MANPVRAAGQLSKLARSMNSHQALHMQGLMRIHASWFLMMAGASKGILLMIFFTKLKCSQLFQLSTLNVNHVWTNTIFLAQINVNENSKKLFRLWLGFTINNTFRGKIHDSLRTFQQNAWYRDQERWEVVWWTRFNLRYSYCNLDRSIQTLAKTTVWLCQQ